MYQKLLLFILSTLFSHTYLFAHNLNECNISDSENEILELNTCQISSNQIEQINSYLYSHPLTHAVSLWQVEIDQKTTLQLIDLLSQHQSINELNLYQADFNARAFEKLSNNTHIKVLTLVGNHITANAFLKLRNNHSIEMLLIHESLVSMQALGQFLDNHPLKYLALTKINNEDIIELCNHPFFKGLSLSFVKGKDLTALKKLNQLTSLRLIEVLIDENNANSISTLSNLEALLLINTGLTKNATKHFAKLKNLHEIQISNYWYSDLYSKLDDESVLFVAHLHKLEKITLFDQNIANNGAIAISHSPNLKAVYLAANQISDKGAIALANHHSIEVLSLDSNKIEDAGGIALAAQKHIKTLGLSANHLTDLSAYAFAKTTTLDELFINQNFFSVEGIKALKSNKYIKNLTVDDEK